MDLAALFDFIKTASPVVVIVCCAAWALKATYDFLDNRRKKLAEEQVAARLAALEASHGATHAMVTNLQQASHGWSHGLSTITDIQRTTSELLGQMLQELVALNAAHNGAPAMGMANSRAVILHQWAWCRDETIRIVVGSIERNHIKGREAAVAAQVSRAWQRAWIDARGSLDKLSGIAIPYTGLFNLEVASRIWHVIWQRALPLYFKDFPIGSGDINDHLTELAEAIKSMFNATFEDFVSCLDEQVEHRNPANERSSATLVVSTKELDAVTAMVQDMQSYQVGSGRHKAKPDTDFPLANQDRVILRQQLEMCVRETHGR